VVERPRHARHRRPPPHQRAVRRLRLAEAARWPSAYVSVGRYLAVTAPTRAGEVLQAPVLDDPPSPSLGYALAWLTTLVSG